MAAPVPKVDPRNAEAVVKQLKELLRHQAPDWNQDDRMGNVLIAIFSRYAEVIIERLNRVPEKNLLAFLDLLGTSPLPPQPARVPLTFTLAEGATADVPVPAGTQVGAEPGEGEQQPVLFETERNFVATSARLQSLFIRVPQRDLYANYCTVLDGSQNNEPLFEGNQTIDHNFYIGHQSLFGCTAIQNLHLTLNLKTPVNAPYLEFGWQVWDGENGIDLFSANNATSTSDVSLAPPKQKNSALLITKDDLLTNVINLNGSGLTVSNLTLREGKGTLVDNKNETWTYTPVANDTSVRITYLLINSNQDMVNGSAIMSINPVDHATEVNRTVETIIRLPPAIPETVIAGLTNRWLRCRLKTPIVDGIKLPEIESIQIKLDSLVHSMRLDAAAYNGQQLDVSKEFFPFGEKPKLGDCFYIAHREGFGRAGATVILIFSVVDPSNYLQKIPSSRTQPTLAWEYWTGGSWEPLTLEIDESGTFTVKGSTNRISFKVPLIKTASIGGVENRWIRARISSGNYGEEGGLGPVIDANGELTKDDKGQIKYKQTPNTLVPPQLAFLTVEFIQEAIPENIVTENDFIYHVVEKKDQDSAEFQAFKPYQAGVENDPAFYMGFILPADRLEFPRVPLSFYFAFLKEDYHYSTRSDGPVPSGPPELVWEYWNGTQWKFTLVQDYTDSLSRSGLVVWLPPADIQKRSDFGKTDHYWLRVRLAGGGYLTMPQLQWLRLNTTLAAQTVTLTNETLGSSNENKGQRFRSTQSPVLSGQQLVIEETEIPAADELALIQLEEGLDVIERSGNPINPSSVWVRWHEVPDFYGSGPRSRHYVMDRMNGEVRFGDGINGLIPPRGVGNIKLSWYQTGGGSAGNKPAGTVNQLQSTLPYIDGVINYAAATGGSDAETQDSVMQHAPKSLRHRFRAVTAEDFEDLALQASFEVARALCVPLLDVEKNPLLYVDTEEEEKAGIGQIGVIIVPRKAGSKPLPDQELIDRVRNYLMQHALATASISVAGPLYLSIDVDAEIVLTTPEAASLVTSEFFHQLNAYLHPLTGAMDGIGWPFGEQPQESDIYRLAATIPGIDHIKALTVNLGGIEEGQGGKDLVDRIKETRRFLIYSGNHTIKLATD